MAAPDPELVARELRSLYSAKRSAQIKRPYKPSARHDKREYWMKSAELCIKLKANPSDFLDAIFEASGRSTVFANALYGPFAESAYRARVDMLKAGLAAGSDSEPSDEALFPSAKLCLLLKFALSTLQNVSGTISMVEKNLQLMRSPFTQYHPAVRVLLAYPDHIVMEKFGKEAKEYFESNPGTLEIAKKMQLPVDRILSWPN